jgi:hypothetical protein
MLKCYKKDHTVIYFANEDHGIHFTTDEHFEEYLKYRKNTPKGCVLFDLKREMIRAIDDGELENAIAVFHNITMSKRRLAKWPKQTSTR